MDTTMSESTSTGTQTGSKRSRLGDAAQQVGLDRVVIVVRIRYITWHRNLESLPNLLGTFALAFVGCRVRHGCVHGYTLNGREVS